MFSIMINRSHVPHGRAAREDRIYLAAGMHDLDARD